MNLRESIIHEALKLFSLNGYLGTGVNDIIAAAHTSKGGFYNHFSSKEQLFLAVLEEAQSIWRAKVLYKVWDISSPIEKIIQILINYQERYLKDEINFPGGCIFITFSVELDDTLPHLMREVNKGFEGFKAMLTGIIKEAMAQGELPARIEPESMAESIFAGMLGASVLYGVHKNELTLNRSINSLIDYLLMLREKEIQA
jgi:TetR/AcrR family transcriptional repressor of nem operon